MVITKKTAVIQRFLQNNLCYLVGVARLELATPTSRTLYATNCATPRIVSFLIDGAKVETFFQSTKFFWNFFPTFFHRGLCKVKSHLILYAENDTIKKIKKKIPKYSVNFKKCYYL